MRIAFQTVRDYSSFNRASRCCRTSNTRCCPHGFFTNTSGRQIALTLSGVPPSLLRQADQAMYDAKHAGRDTWRLATASSVEATPH